MSDTFKQSEATVARLAQEGYARHVVVSRGPNEWRFAEPGTSVLASHLILRPGAVIVYGDLGEWILRHSEKESLEWLRGAVPCRDYLLGKIKAGDKDRFYPADAMALLIEVLPDGEEQEAALRAKVLEDLEGVMYSGDEPTAEEWGRAWMEAGSDCEFPRCENDSEGALWLYETLKAFVSTLDGAIAQMPDAALQGEVL